MAAAMTTQHAARMVIRRDLRRRSARRAASTRSRAVPRLPFRPVVPDAMTRTT
jgi:hypothetical protein